MNQEKSIWFSFFICVFMLSHARYSDPLLSADQNFGASYQKHSLLDSSEPSLLPELSELDQISSESSCKNIEGLIHKAMAATSSTATTRGGIYVLSGLRENEWTKTVRVFSNNSAGYASSPNIACDDAAYRADRSNPYRNRIYLVWLLENTKDSSSEFSQIMFALSLDRGNSFVCSQDGGQSWTPIPMRLSVGSSKVSKARVSLEDDRNVIVSWTDENSGAELFRRSRNGGISFDPVESH